MERGSPTLAADDGCPARAAAGRAPARPGSPAGRPALHLRRRLLRLRHHRGGRRRRTARWARSEPPRRWSSAWPCAAAATTCSRRGPSAPAAAPRCARCWPAWRRRCRRRRTAPSSTASTSPDRPRLLTLPPGTARRLADELDELRRRAAARRAGAGGGPRAGGAARGGRPPPRRGRRRRARRAARSDRGRRPGAGQRRRRRRAASRGGRDKDGQPVPVDQAAAGLARGGRGGRAGASARRRPTCASTCAPSATASASSRARCATRRARPRGAVVDEELPRRREPFPQPDVAAFLDDVRAGRGGGAIVEVARPRARGPGALPARASPLPRERASPTARAWQGAPVVEEPFPTRARTSPASIEPRAGGAVRLPRRRVDHPRRQPAARRRRLPRGAGAGPAGGARGLGCRSSARSSTGVLEIGGASLGAVRRCRRALEPDPVPVDVKVVLIGERWAHDALYGGDPDFRKLFGVRADFAGDMPRTPEAQRRYAEVVAGIAAREGLPPATADGARRAGGGGRRAAPTAATGSTARFSETRQRRARGGAPGPPARGGGDRAARTSSTRGGAREQRDGRMEERLQAMLEEGTLLVATSGRDGGPGQRPVGLRPRLPRVRQADPHHGVGGAGPRRHHQRGARGAALGRRSTTRAC